MIPCGLKWFQVVPYFNKYKLRPFVDKIFSGFPSVYPVL